MVLEPDVDDRSLPGGRHDGQRGPDGTSRLTGSQGRRRCQSSSVISANLRGRGRPRRRRSRPTGCRPGRPGRGPALDVLVQLRAGGRAPASYARRQEHVGRTRFRAPAVTPPQCTITRVTDGPVRQAGRRCRSRSGRAGRRPIWYLQWPRLDAGLAHDDPSAPGGDLTGTVPWLPLGHPACAWVIRLNRGMWPGQPEWCLTIQPTDGGRVASQGISPSSPTNLVYAASGVDYAYRDTGAGEGMAPLVLLQRASAGTWTNWDPALIGRAGRGASEVVTFDNAGVGGSTGTTPDTIEQMARDAIAFLAATWSSARWTCSGFSYRQLRRAADRAGPP